MSRLGRAAVAGMLLALSSTALAADERVTDDWRGLVPEGWLAVAEVQSLPLLEERLGVLRAPWGEKAWPLTQLVPSFIGSLPADRPWAFAAIESERAEATLVLFVPTDDFDAFCKGIDADRADDLAIGRLLGNEVAAVWRNGWAMLTFVDDAATLDLPSATALPRAFEAELGVTFSPTGLKLAAKEAGERHRQQLASRRNRRRVATPFRLPTDLGDLIRLLTPNAPVYQSLADAGQPVSLGVSVSETTGDLQLLAEWDLAVPAAESGGAERLAGDTPIARLDLSGPLPAPLIDLFLAAIQSLPAHLIEAAEFPQPQWDDFADAARNLLAGIRSPSALLTLPGEADPIAANQAIAFQWPGEADQLGDALGFAVLRWNLLVATAKARSPMQVAIEPLNAEPLNAKPLADEPGWLFSVDVLAAAGREPIPEEKQVLKAFYGNEERLLVRITQRPSGGWLASTLPPDTPVQSRALPLGADELATGEVDLARWLAWDHRIKTFGLEDAIGPTRKPPNLPATATAKLRLTGGQRVRLEASLPKATFEAVAKLWNTANKR